MLRATTANVSRLRLGNGTVTGPAYSFSSDPDTGMYSRALGTLSFSVNGSNVFDLGPGAAQLSSVLYLGWSSSTPDAAESDCRLSRDAANTLAQRNDTAAQAFRLYNTFTDASNYERLEAAWASNILSIGTTAAGTGTVRALRLATGGTGRWEVGATTGHLLGITATGGVGYGTGAGGTVTQLTSKSTGVTLNTITGTITMQGASLAADTTVSFTLTDSAIAATDAVIVIHESVGTLGAYSFASTAAAGSASISVHNNTPGALSEAIVLRFVVIKSVNA